MGFRIFYDSLTGQKAQEIIRQKAGYEKVKAIDYADNIFRSVYLNKYYQSAVEGHSVDWQELEDSFKGGLDQDFIHRNILSVRVAAADQFEEVKRYGLK